MSDLAALQHSFRAYLLAGDPAIAQRLAPAPRAPQERVLRIYGYAYAARLVEVLGEDFPGLKLLAGDERFERLARAYVAAYPSTTPSVRWFGRHLPDFLRSAEPWSGLPVLADMAAFEWAMGHAFDAGDAPHATLDALAALPPETWGGIVMALHPSVGLLALGHDVAPFRRAAEQGTDPDGPPAVHAATWALWRHDLIVRYRELPPMEAEALLAVQAGRTFGEICEDLAAALGTDEAPGAAVQFLAGWLNAGMVTHLVPG